MPCSDGGYAYGYEAEREKRLHLLARVACDAMTALTKQLANHSLAIEMVVSAETLAWWKDHQERDARRRAQEAEAADKERRIKAALKKLSPAERKLLGIK